MAKKMVKEKQVPDIDSPWFFDRLEAQKLSLRGLAKLLEMSPSSLSLRFDGTYKITMEEASAMAPLLGTTFEEIVLHAGIKVPKAPGGSVKVVGTVTAEGSVKIHKGQGVTARPGALPAETVALSCEKSNWMYFYAPSERVLPDAVGRLSVVEIGGDATLKGHSDTPLGGKNTPLTNAKGGRKGVLGVLKRGSERGVWDVEGVCGGGVKGVRVVTATPVLMILP